MAKSMTQLREQLSAIEPDERTYEGIGPSEVPLLRDLVHEVLPRARERVGPVSGTVLSFFGFRSARMFSACTMKSCQISVW